MDRIADEESGVVRAVADDSTTHHAVQMESGVTEDQLKRRHATLTLVGEGDLSTTELQLRLELERLKYKVLEQELMLVRQQVWSHPRHEFNAEAENVKALDYKQSVNHVHAEVRLPPAYKEDIKSRNDAAQDNEDKEGVDPEESDNTTMTQNITSAAEVGNDSVPATIIESAEDVDTSDLNDESGRNATDDENQSHEEEQQPEAEVKVIKTYGNDPDVIDFDEESTVVAGEEKVVEEVPGEAEAEDEAEDETLVVEEEETIELPNLFVPFTTLPLN